MLPNDQSQGCQIYHTEESVAILYQGSSPVFLAVNVRNEPWYEGENVEHQEDVSLFARPPIITVAV